MCAEVIARLRPQSIDEACLAGAATARAYPAGSSEANLKAATGENPQAADESPAEKVMLPTDSISPAETLRLPDVASPGSVETAPTEMDEPHGQRARVGSEAEIEQAHVAWAAKKLPATLSGGESGTDSRSVKDDVFGSGIVVGEQVIE